ncbi:type I-C CRISPR-associated protein Cas5c [Streptomyces sp. TRM 70351]|uniref:type I-C CRISPR-associated protein Cas5c n=1 Tax=Streptomyces sp. TRM 70351 TaxID=3116552 RepID=UPI002E7BFDC8|nr:type I-C CRISPR-associated protein Cas5c [Streptomyces sp. TRM 70351]MEE1928310.1 type I-C CRISPR-associated protein Cas5c [Streptomyces sp. TRM 70351]
MDTTVSAPRREGRGNDGWAFPDLVVETWGELACFTRPELKTERVSYQVMTPSAADGLLRAIFWKPEFQYIIRRIEVLAPINWHRIRRNEVQSVVTPQRIKSMSKDRRVRYDVEADRDQRSTMALRDVRYRIHAQIAVSARARAGSGQHPPVSEEKYREQLRRRVERGACFSQPFFGCREFTAHFGPASSSAKPITRTEELGVMLHSIAYTPQGERYRWFRASLTEGVMDVPLAPLPGDAVSMPQASWRAADPEG